MQVQVRWEDRAGDGRQGGAVILTQKGVHAVVDGKIRRPEHLRTAYREYQIVCGIVIAAQVFHCFKPRLRTSIFFD